MPIIFVIGCRRRLIELEIEMFYKTIKIQLPSGEFEVVAAYSTEDADHSVGVDKQIIVESLDYNGTDMSCLLPEIYDYVVLLIEAEE